MKKYSKQKIENLIKIIHNEGCWDIDCEHCFFWMESCPSIPTSRSHVMDSNVKSRLISLLRKHGNLTEDELFLELM